MDLCTGYDVPSGVLWLNYSALKLHLPRAIFFFSNLSVQGITCRLLSISSSPFIVFLCTALCPRWWPLYDASETFLGRGVIMTFTITSTWVPHQSWWVPFPWSHFCKWPFYSILFNWTLWLCHFLLTDKSESDWYSEHCSNLHRWTI